MTRYIGCEVSECFPGALGSRVPDASHLIDSNAIPWVPLDSEKRQGTPAKTLLVLLHALEALFKLRDQRRFARLEAVASHDAPEIVAARPVVSIVDG